MIAATARAFLATESHSATVEIGPQNRQHDARHAAAGPDIQHRFARFQKSLQPLAIDDIAGDEFFVVGMPGQIEPRVPIPKPLAVVVQQRDLIVGKFDAVPGKRGGRIVGRVHDGCNSWLPYMYRLRRGCQSTHSANAERGSRAVSRVSSANRRGHRRLAPCRSHFCVERKASAGRGQTRLYIRDFIRADSHVAPPHIYHAESTLNRSMWPNSDETQRTSVRSPWRRRDGRQSAAGTPSGGAAADDRFADGSA